MHLFCVPRLTASCFCPFLLFTKRRKPQRGKEGKGCWSLKVFCAPADARRRKLCIARFHAGVKTDSRRCVSFPPHKRCAGLCGGFWASSEGLRAFPDAQPLTLAVVGAWQNHLCSSSCGGTIQRFRRTASANLGESKGAAHGLKRLFGFFNLCICAFSASRA